MESTEQVEASGGRAKVGRYSRNRSIMSITNNPFQAAAASDDLKVEVLTDAVLISDSDFNDLIMGPLKTTSDNEERLTMLERMKQPYLFASSQLQVLCNLTTSLKTRLEFIKQLGPRLVDPTAMASTFDGMFRFVEEKMQVEQVLKDRNATISKTQFTNVRRNSNLLASRGGRGGGAGRGPRASMTSAASEATASAESGHEHDHDQGHEHSTDTVFDFKSGSVDTPAAATDGHEDSAIDQVTDGVEKL